MHDVAVMRDEYRQRAKKYEDGSLTESEALELWAAARTQRYGQVAACPEPVL
jgi:hypothetical protein